MVNVSLNDTVAEDVSYVDILPFLECSSWNHPWFLCFEVCL